MNVAAKVLEQSQGMEGRMGCVVFNQRAILFSLLLLLVFASAFAVIYTRQTSRDYIKELQMLQQAHYQLRTESKQLLLEQTTWAQQARVQEVATNELQMVFADASDVMMVRT